MNTYTTTISYATENGNTQSRVMNDIAANNVVEAFMSVIGDFFNEYGNREIRRIIIELQQSMWNDTGDIYCGS